MLLGPGAKRIAAVGGPVAGQFRYDGGWGGLTRWSSRWEMEMYKGDGVELGEESMAGTQLEFTSFLWRSAV